MTSTQFKRRLLATTLAAGALAAAAPAAAQAQAARDKDASSVEEVVVTGSRIPHRETESLQPIVVTTTQLIENSGLNNLGNIVRESPLFQAYDQTTGDRASANQGDAGVTFANLYNLGSQRTLTLVDGKRVVGAASANGAGSNGLQVDISAIPTGLVDHIETISVGGAPVYGSDAIAGTVNIILKDHFQGLEVDGNVGETEREDGFNSRIQVLWGSDFAGGRGNAVLSAAYTKQDPVLAKDRDWSIPALVGSIGNPQLNDAVSGVGFGGVSQYGRPTTLFGIGGVSLSGQPQYFYTDASGAPLTFDRSGALVPFNPGTAAAAYIPPPYDVALVTFISPDDQDTERLVGPSIVSPSERYFLNGMAHYDLTDHLRANARFSYTHTSAEFLASSPASTGLAASGPVLVFPDNPFLTPSERAYFASHPSPFTGSLIGLNREYRDVVPGVTDIDQDSWNVQAGLQGDFNAFGRNWNWDLTVSKGETDRDTNAIGMLSQRLAYAQQAVYANSDLTAVLPTPAGLDYHNFTYDEANHLYRENGTGNVITCGVRVNTPAALAGDPAVSGCAPFNPFGANNPEDALNYLRGNQFTRSVIKQQYAQGNINGDLFDLPAGPLKFAAGFEIRKEQASFDLDADSAAGNYFQTGAGNALPLSGFTTREIYSEVRAPLIDGDMLENAMGARLFERLEFEGAVRYMSNTQAGTDLAWTAGGRLQFTPDLMIRGNKTKSVRQPSVAELFSGTEPRFQSVTDPCAIGVIDTGPNPAARRTNCEAAVIAAGLAGNTAEADTFLSTFTTPLTGVPGNFSGNPQLNSETANSWTIGAVLTPRFLPGFTATVDWININIDGAITAIDGTGVADNCVDDPNGLSNIYCPAITRGPNFHITGFSSFYANVDRREFAGLTVNAHYGMDLGHVFTADQRNLGGLTLDATVFYLDHDREGLNGNLVDSVGATGSERWRAQFGVGYNYGPWGLYWQTRYYAKSQIDPNDGAALFLYNDVASYTISDVTVRYDLTNAAQVQLTVNNVFDKDPPFNSFAYQFDRLGRRYQLGFKYKF